MKKYFQRMKATGSCPPRRALDKIIWSWIGGFLGIFLIALLEKYLSLSPLENVFLTGSFGATAVLLYAAPMAEFSQPRNLIGGHTLSAIVGVSVYMLMGSDNIASAATAVSLAIVVMHFTRTLHPPGGATALIAVIGGEKIYALGYMYVISPVLFGALALLLVALLTNNMSSNPKRHYPVYWF